MSWPDQGLQPLRRPAGGSLSKLRQPHIRGAILHFLRDRVGLIRLPRAVEERAMQMVRSSEGSALSPADALVVDHYRSKQHWVEFNDDLLDDTAQGMDLVERSESWSCLLYTSPSPRDLSTSRMPSSA